MKRLIIASLFATFVFNSCGSSRHETLQTGKKNTEHEMIKNPPPGPAPGTCKIIATVETIDRMLKGTGDNDPCSKAPCSATIRIDSVLGYGSAFPKPLLVGQLLRVRFAHTLNPTKEMWPDVKPSLPGLRIKDTFEAIVTGSMTMGNSEPSFTIYGYEKK